MRIFKKKEQEHSKFIVFTKSIITTYVVVVNLFAKLTYWKKIWLIFVWCESFDIISNPSGTVKFIYVKSALREMFINTFY